MKLRKGNVFTCVCYSVHRGVGYAWSQVPSGRVDMPGLGPFQEGGGYTWYTPLNIHPPEGTYPLEGIPPQY